jgi:hypothetical protein
MKKKTQPTPMQPPPFQGTQIQPLPAEILCSFYSNTVMVLNSKDEVVLLFGQMPVQYDGTILAVRIYIQRDFADKLVGLINSSLNKDKKEENDGRYIYG